MDGEIHNFIKVWIAAVASVFYSYYVAKRIPSGIFRLVSLLPVLYLFITLPIMLSSLHLGIATVFYLLWLGNFKLLLFSFDQGPLASQPPLSLLHFISIALLPIKTRTDSSISSPPDAENYDRNNKNSLVKSPSNAKNGNKRYHPPISRFRLPSGQHFKIFGAALLAIKLIVLAKIMSLYRFKEDFHPGVIMAMYCCYLYIVVELVLAVTAVPVRAILRLEIEPQFNEPYLSSSLQDFWGRRWNLMVASILRPTVYIPIRSISTPVLGRKWSLIAAIMATYLVSGLMHEILYYYLTRSNPTWEVTWFFILHGISLACEIAIKKAVNGRWRLHRVVSGTLALGFTVVTGSWLFFPQLIRNGVDERAINEYWTVVHFVGDMLRLPNVAEVLH